MEFGMENGRPAISVHLPYFWRGSAEEKRMTVLANKHEKDGQFLLIAQQRKSFIKTKVLAKCLKADVTVRIDIGKVEEEKI